MEINAKIYNFSNDSQNRIYFIRLNFKNFLSNFLGREWERERERVQTGFVPFDESKLVIIKSEIRVTAKTAPAIALFISDWLFGEMISPW